MYLSFSPVNSTMATPDDLHDLSMFLFGFNYFFSTYSVLKFIKDLLCDTIYKQREYIYIIFSITILHIKDLPGVDDSD